MKANVKNSDFVIGNPEAWHKSERKHMHEYFLRTKEFSQISDEDKIFLTGRRGTGKSAIAMMLEADAKDVLTEAVQGEAEEYGAYMDIVKDLATASVPGASMDIKAAVKRLWLWVLPVKAMQVILDKRKQCPDLADADMTPMVDYFRSLPTPLHKGSRIGDLLSTMFAEAKGILVREGQAGFDKFVIGLAGSEGFMGAVAALRKVTASHPILILFDTLESYRLFQPYMIEGMQGVLEAIVAFLADKHLDGVYLKFFMPSEIYEDVLTGFPGKVQSRSVALRWGTPDLMSMLARRYLGILQRTDAVEPSETKRLTAEVDRAYEQRDDHHLRGAFWYDTGFLPQKVVNVRGVPEDCFAYMMRHTQRRPRDILTQMQHIINESRAREEFPRISQESVRAGVHNDTTLLQILGDALTPYEGKIPGHLITAARAAFYGRSTLMSGRELRRFAQELYNLQPLEYVDPSIFVELLLRCGVVGIAHEEDLKRGLPGMYCKAKFEYIMEGTLPVADRFTYCVHPVMGDIFRMKPAESIGVVYPMPEHVERLEKDADIA